MHGAQFAVLHCLVNRVLKPRRDDIETNRRRHQADGHGHHTGQQGQTKACDAQGQGVVGLFLARVEFQLSPAGQLFQLLLALAAEEGVDVLADPAVVIVIDVKPAHSSAPSCITLVPAINGAFAIFRGYGLGDHSQPAATDGQSPAALGRAAKHIPGLGPGFPGPEPRNSRPAPADSPLAAGPGP